jgi:hypothetical protein
MGLIARRSIAQPPPADTFFAAQTPQYAPAQIKPALNFSAVQKKKTFSASAKKN